MCAGCCGYIVDEKVSKVPLIGNWLAMQGGREAKNRRLQKLFAWLYRKEIEKCVKDFEKLY